MYDRLIDGLESSNASAELGIRIAVPLFASLIFGLCQRFHLQAIR